MKKLFFKLSVITTMLITLIMFITMTIIVINVSDIV
jgi:hypothetical protein